MNQAQLEKLAKKLAAEREHIDTQVEFIKESNLTEKIILGKLEVAQSELKSVYDEIDKELEDGYKELDSLRLDTQELTYKNSVLDAANKSKKKLQIELDDKLAESKRALKLSEARVEERNKYYRQQEELIDTTVGDANEKLLELKSLTDDLEDGIKALKREEIQLNKTNDELVLEINGLEVKRDDLTAKLESETSKSETSLRHLDELIADKNTELRDVSKEIDSKMISLREKEEAVRAKMDTLILETQKLRTEKRRWESIKELNAV